MTDATVPAPETTGDGGTMRRVGRHTVIYGVGIVLSKAVAFIMLPLYTRYLSASDYGVLQLIDMTLEVIAIVGGSRLGAGVFHLYHKATSEQARREVLGSAFTVLGAAYLVAGAASYALAPLAARVVFGDDTITPLIRIAALSLGLQALLMIPLSYVQLRERSALYVGLNFGKLLLQLTLNVVLLVHFRLAARGVLLSALAANLAIGLPLVGLFLRDVGWHVSARAVRDIVRLGVPFIGVQLAKFVQTFGDRYFLKAVASTAVVGVYALAYQFGFLLAQIGFAPFIQVWEPLRFEVAKRPDRDAIFNRVFLFLNLGLFTMAVGISLFVGDFLRIAAGPSFQGAAPMVPVVLIAYILQSWNGFNNFGLFAAERTELITVAYWVGAVVALVGYAVLIPRYYGMGAAVATAVSFGASTWLTQRQAQRVYPMPYQWGPIVRLAAAATAIVVVAQLLPRVNVLAAIGLHVALFVAYCAAVWSLGVLSDDNRARLRRMRLSPRSMMAALTGQDAD